MKYSEFIHKEPGSVVYYERDSVQARMRLYRQISGYVSRMGAKLKYTSFNAFEAKTGEPVYILKIELLQTARKLKPRGRPSK